MAFIPDSSDLVSVKREIPVSLIAGDTKTFTLSFVDLTDANGWALTYIVRGKENNLTLAGVANGDSFDFTIAANKTENWKEQYAVYALLAKHTDGRRFTIADGSIQIYANPENKDYGERLREIQEAIDFIDDFKMKYAKDPKISKSFGGRTFNRSNIAEFLAFEAHMRKKFHIMKHGQSLGRKTIYLGL